MGSWNMINIFLHWVFENMDTFMVPATHDKNAEYPAFTWNDDQHSLFLLWDSFTFDNIWLWQYCIHKRCNEHDQVRSILSQSSFCTSAAVELSERVDSKYKDLPSYYKGGIAYLFLQLKTIFFMSHDMINALRRYLKLFESNGLCRIFGMNV